LPRSREASPIFGLDPGSWPPDREGAGECGGFFIALLVAFLLFREKEVNFRPIVILSLLLLAVGL